ncbi:MAG: glycosyltransferase, partial [Euryarchaeota archaeon]|nr:glycosyltransferase [Euryarchaeota archaeon]
MSCPRPVSKRPRPTSAASSAEAAARSANTAATGRNTTSTSRSSKPIGCSTSTAGTPTCTRSGTSWWTAASSSSSTWRRWPFRRRPPRQPWPRRPTPAARRRRFLDAETPEGPNCGLVKNLALTVEISEGFPDREVEKVLTDLGLKPVSKEVKGARVYLNGDLVGLHEKPGDLTENLRNRRRKGLLSNEVNVYFDEDANDVVINCDAGRVRRPIAIVRNGKVLVKEEHIQGLKEGRTRWSDLISEGLVEYVDAEEEENAFIGLTADKVTPDHTHVELYPMVILGIGASLVPYPEPYPAHLPTKPIRAVYHSTLHFNLRVIDKVKSGKADALNAGINVSRYPLICSIDADSVLQRDSLHRVVQPFLENPSTVASCGTVRVRNGCEVSGGFLTEVGLPRSLLALFQVVEY